MILVCVRLPRMVLLGCMDEQTDESIVCNSEGWFFCLYEYLSSYDDVMYDNMMQYSLSWSFA